MSPCKCHEVCLLNMAPCIEPRNERFLDLTRLLALADLGIPVVSFISNDRGFIMEESTESSEDMADFRRRRFSRFISTKEK